MVPGPQLVPDYNRDGKIDAADYERLAAGEAFTIWINDDDDADGDEKGDTNNDLHDVPGGEDSDGNPHDKDCADKEVNGRCDLLDFVPVLVNVHEVGDWENMTWKLCSKSANVVFTTLKADHAGDFHTAKGEKEIYGPELNQYAYEATVSRLVDGDEELPEGFLDKKGQGVIMVEGAALGEGLTLRGEGGDGAEVTLDLRVKDVEKMYGWMNLRPREGKSKSEVEVVQRRDENSIVQPPTSNLQPDNRHFILVHGYNTNHEEARGNAAEFYKKLWQSGSDAKFTAVEWYGNQSQFEIFGLTVTPNYFVNVENAFLAARPFAEACKKLTGEKILVGHSLGNVLISSAIKDYGLDYTKFVMLNAAVPREAFDASAYDEDMVDDDWLGDEGRGKGEERRGMDSLTNHLDRAARWYRNFAGKEYDPYEYRRKLAWRGRFANLPRTVNYYSPTDNILLNPDPHEPDPDKYEETEVWIAYLNRLGVRTPEKPNQKTGFGFWSFSEKMKGTWVVDAINGVMTNLFDFAESDAMKLEAGWGENGKYVEGKSFDPANTRFTPFLDERLKTQGMLDILPAETERLRAQHLADAIPAESFAAGANPVGTLENVNEEDFIGENPDWPLYEGEEVRTNLWNHSAFREVAFYHTSKFYTSLAAIGKPRIIIDTDLGSSMDDLFAVDLAARMHKAGKLDLMAVMMDRPDYSDNEHKGEFLTFADRYLASLGLGDLPIGRSIDQTKQGQPVFNPYWTLIYSNNLTGVGLLLPTNRTPDQINNSLTNAVALYRRLLRKAPDKSVVICSTGFLSNLKELMESGTNYEGDDIYSTGLELIAAKVKELRIMGGCFDYSVAPDGTGDAEYNFAGDPTAAKKVVEEWPTPVILSTWEVGLKLEYQPEDVLADFPAGTFDPAVRSAYKYWPEPLREGDRNCLWDPMTVLPLTEGETLVPLSSNGMITVDEKGKTTFEANAFGTRRYQMSSNMNATAVMNRYRAICRTGNPSLPDAVRCVKDAGVDYNGHELTFKVPKFPLGAYGQDDVHMAFAFEDGACAKAYEPDEVTYDPILEVFSVHFTVPAEDATAWNFYNGALTITLDNEKLGPNVVKVVPTQIVQGAIDSDDPADWFYETDLVAPTNYVPATEMPEGRTATVDTTFVFEAPSEATDEPPEGVAQAAVRIVEDVARGGYKFQYYAFVASTNGYCYRGWHDFNVENETEIRPVVGNPYIVRMEGFYLEDSRGEINTLAISVKDGYNDVFHKQFVGNLVNADGGVGGTKRLNSVDFEGNGKIETLEGIYSVNRVNANLAKIDGVGEYATVAEAVAAANGQPVRLLHKASWKPTAADLGKPVKLLNKGRLVLDDSELPPGSAASWSDVDGNNGTLTLLPLGAEKNPWLVGTTNRADVVAWTNGTDCLVIEGRGAMMDFETVGPWGTGIAEVDFGAQVTNFGANAFAGCTLTDLTMRGNPPAIGTGNDFSRAQVIVREDALAKFEAADGWKGLTYGEPLPVCYNWQNVKTLAPFLHEVWYGDYTFDEKGETLGGVEMFSCSSVRNGNFIGRNFDFFLDDKPEFVVHVAADPAKGRLASVAMAMHTGMREDGVTNGQYTASYDLIPNRTLDGINEKGVAINQNVVAYDSEVAAGAGKEFTGTNPGAPDLNISFVTRMVLDRATNAAHAVELIKSRNLVGMSVSGDILHYMISDPKETYVVEIVTNTVVARHFTMMTNFAINWDNEHARALTDADNEVWTKDYYPEPSNLVVEAGSFVAATNELAKYYARHAEGVERFVRLRDNYAEGATFEGMEALMRRAQYSQSSTFETRPYWYSDRCSVDLDRELTKLGYPAAANTYMLYGLKYYKDEADPDDLLEGSLDDFLEKNFMANERECLANKDDHRKDNCGVWLTVHNTTYDIEKRMFRVAVQEDYERTFDIYLVESVPVTPGEPIVCDTAEEATNVAKKAVLAPRPDVEKKLGKGSLALEAYRKMFTLDVVPFGKSQWAVEAFLLPPDWTNVVESAQEATLQLPIEDIAAWQLGDDPILVHLTNCVPGFYYSLYDGAEVTELAADFRKENCNVLCGAEKTVDLPEVTPPPGCTTSGFFFVGVLEAPLPFIPGSTDSRTNRYTGPKKPVRQH